MIKRTIYPGGDLKTSGHATLKDVKKKERAAILWNNRGRNQAGLPRLKVCILSFESPKPDLWGGGGERRK